MEHGDSFISILRVPKQFATSLLWAAPLYVLAFLVLLLFAAGLYVGAAADHGTWMAIGSWSLVVFYAVVGIVAGVAAGILSAAHGLLTSVESVLHTGLRHLPPFTQNPEPAPLSVDDARVRYATLVDRLLNQVLGYVPLPGWFDGKLRSWIQDAIVTEFITLCRNRGMTSIPPQEFRNWLLAQGATLALSPLHDQISLWQYALFGLIGLLGGGTLLLAYFVA
jgi:hypothetical protein